MMFMDLNGMVCPLRWKRFSSPIPFSNCCFKTKNFLLVSTLDFENTYAGLTLYVKLILITVLKYIFPLNFLDY